MVVAIATSRKWRDLVDLRIYHLDQDSLPGKPYQPITTASVLINQTKKITPIHADSVQRGLEQAAKKSTN